jgi:hypothetical protein
MSSWRRRLGVPGVIVALGLAGACSEAGEDLTSPDSSDVVSLAEPGEELTPLFQHVDPVFVADNPSCTDLGYSFGFKPQPEPPPTGDYGFPNTNLTVSISSDGTYFDWTSDLGVDAVIVKGGPNANLYVYDPPQESLGDDGLHSPINPNNDEPFAISHIEFCYDFEVDVSKDAATELTRTYDWGITKDPNGSYVGFPGDAFAHEYTITVDRTGFTDSDWAVSGTITIENNTPLDATIESVSDVISGGVAATVDCGVDFPHTLASGESLSCTYSAGLSDGTDRLNTATVGTSGDVGGGEATADVDFSNATITEVNAEVNVTDDFGTSDTGDDKDFGPLGDDASVNYSRDFVCPTDLSLYTDGVYTESVTNTATIDETGDSDDATVDLTCYVPATAKVVKTTTEGGEDIGQFPFSFQLYAPSGDLIETKTLGTSGGDVTFDADLEDEGTWTVKEILPAGWVSTTDLTCEIVVAYPGSENQTYTCDFDNVEMGRVNLLKLTNGLPTTNQVWSFTLYDAYGNAVATDGTPPALLDFGNVDLIPGATYTVCESPIPASWTVQWAVDENGNGVIDAGETLPFVGGEADLMNDGLLQVYDPDPNYGQNGAVNDTRCVNFQPAPGEITSFIVDNQERRSGGRLVPAR